MTGHSARCARILRVRAIEHRLAAARQAAADRRIADLLGVAGRIAGLRTSLHPGFGSTEGQSLRAMAEMQQRLERAERDLAQPISAAEVSQAVASAARLAARTREDGIERLRTRAAAREETQTSLREDANRPARIIRRTAR